MNTQTDQKLSSVVMEPTGRTAPLPGADEVVGGGYVDEYSSEVGLLYYIQCDEGHYAEFVLTPRDIRFLNDFANADYPARRVIEAAREMTVAFRNDMLNFALNAEGKLLAKAALIQANMALEEAFDEFDASRRDPHEQSHPTAE